MFKLKPIKNRKIINLSFQFLAGLLIVFGVNQIVLASADVRGVVGDVFSDVSKKLQHSSGSEIDPANILGIDPDMTNPNKAREYGSALSSASGGGVGNLEIKKNGSNETKCEVGKTVLVAGVDVKIISCPTDENNNELSVAVCDLSYRGLACNEDQYSTPQNIGASARVFQGAPLEQLHSLKAGCDQGTCLFEISSIIKESGVGCKHFAGADPSCPADTGMVSSDRYEGMANHPLSIVNSISSGSDLDPALLQELKDMKNDDCDEWRFEIFLETGEMPATCDKSNPIRYSFPEYLDDSEEMCRGGITKGTCTTNIETKIVTCKDREEVICDFERMPENKQCHEDLNVTVVKSDEGAAELKNITGGGGNNFPVTFDTNTGQLRMGREQVTSYWGSGVHKRWTTFEIDNISLLTRFDLTHVRHDDVVQILVNGNQVFHSLQASITTQANTVQFFNCGLFSYINVVSNSNHKCKASGNFKFPEGDFIIPLDIGTSSQNVNINIIPFLKKGVNKIELVTGVINGGHSWAHFVAKQQTVTQTENLTNNCAPLFNAVPQDWTGGSNHGSDGDENIHEDNLYECFQQGSRVCVDKVNPRVISGVEVTKPCWKWEYNFICYGSVESSCNVPSLINDGMASTGEVPGSEQYPKGGSEDNLPVKWKEIFDRPGVCDGSMDFGCKFIDGSGNTERYRCYTGDTPTCYPK